LFDCAALAALVVFDGFSVLCADALASWTGEPSSAEDGVETAPPAINIDTNSADFKAIDRAFSNNISGTILSINNG
jgi:hypothetical protein